MDGASGRAALNETAGAMAGGTVAAHAITLPVRIRHCRADELPALEWYGLHTPQRRIIHDTYAATETGDAAMLVADIGGFPAGQVWIDFARKRRHGLATLWALRVFAPFRRAGLGRALMRAAEGVVLEYGVTAAELGVDRDNAGIIGFYEDLGYALSGNERGTHRYRTPDGVLVEVAIDQWLMRKDLVPAQAVRHRAAR